MPCLSWIRSRRVALPLVAACACILGLARVSAAQETNPTVSIFMGSAIDSFAAGDLKNYINPDKSSELTEQLIAGFDFEYQLSRRGERGVVLFGQTMHGAKSGEVDCTKDGNATKDVCKLAGFDLPSPKQPLAIFRQATTLEGFVGLRAEFMSLGTGESPARAYVKGQLGFLSVAGKGGDLVDQHQVAVGLRLNDGTFEGSFFELGYGRNDLFQDNHGRKIVDALLTFGKGADPNVKPFFEIFVDSDFRNGPDNLQLFMGLEVNVLKMFR